MKKLLLACLLLTIPCFAQDDIMVDPGHPIDPIDPISPIVPPMEGVAILHPVGETALMVKFQDDGKFGLDYYRIRVVNVYDPRYPEGGLIMIWEKIEQGLWVPAELPLVDTLSPAMAKVGEEITDEQ